MVCVNLRPVSIAVALLVAITSPAASAQSGGNVLASAAPMQFDIGAQTLAQALNEWARQSRVQLIVRQGLVAGKMAPAISGAYRPRDVLDRLLAGSGLEAVSDGGSVVVQTATPTAIRPPGSTTLSTIDVTATSAAQATSLRRTATSGALGRRSVLDTPFSITSVGSEEMETRLVTTLEQALRYDPAVQLTGSEYGHGASISVRGLGLDTSNGFKVDGLPITAWGTGLPMELFDRVDLQKGITGFMNGFGSPGGVANYVLKRPTDERLLTASVGFKSKSLFSQSLDAGGRFGTDDRFGYRANVLREEGDTFIRGGSMRRTGASIALDARLTKDLTASVDFLYADRASRGNSFWGLDLNRLYASRPGVVPTPNDPKIQSQPDGAFYNTNDRVATAGLQWRIAPGWNASATYRNARRESDYNYSTLYVTSLAGDYTADRSTTKFVQEFDHAQAMVDGEFNTGPVSHRVVVGASRQRFQNRANAVSNYAGDIGSSNIYRDSPLTITGSSDGVRMYRSSVIEQSAAFVSDTLSLGEQWSLIAGLRYNRYDQTGANAAGTPTTPYKRSPLTPTLALMFKPTPGSTLYVSAVEALERGGTAPANVVNRFEVLGPIKSKQYEAGYKFEQGAWSGTAALFRLDRTAGYTNAANYYVQDGITRYQGADISGRYRFDSQLSVIAGVMLLDAKYEEAAAALNGKRTAGTPRVQAALAANYNVAALPGLSLNGGLKYIGASYLDTANTYRLSPYTVVDAGASYSTRLVGKDVTFTAAIHNLAGRRYWIYNGSNYIASGAPRTVSLNARMAF
jgi:iron complex outermembrane receptor protein